MFKLKQQLTVGSISFYLWKGSMCLINYFDPDILDMNIYDYL